MSVAVMDQAWMNTGGTTGAAVSAAAQVVESTDTVAFTAASDAAAGPTSALCDSCASISELEAHDGTCQEEQWRFDTTQVIVAETSSIKGESDDEEEPRRTPLLFALISRNELTAASLEVSWADMFALGAQVNETSVPHLKVGRNKDCHIQLSDPRVSQVHFEVRAHQADPKEMAYSCTVVDHSSNGTSINGKLIGKGNSAQLCSGDEVSILSSDKVGAESSICFLFRNTSEMRPSKKVSEEAALPLASSQAALHLEEHVSCPICMQAIYKCVALVPCLHNFCMACFSEWIAMKKTCPVCRQQATAVVKNHSMDALIEAYLEASPSRRRPKAELDSMDSKDRLKLGPGEKFVFEVARAADAPFGSASAAPAAAVASAGAASASTAAQQSRAAAQGNRPSNSEPASAQTTAAPPPDEPAHERRTRPRGGSPVCTVQ
mmetsp:Transcript_57312/g.136232  ORF Transcript_57312/g.136232 Transcript_57312/m.136232 type:complete len:435 (-) Transcript_57312:126-1430(-)|eukprot:CAMPEP_0178383600 /NCGR_PEP_ID=MMETSP0689_2-20121128/7084_1 /TAXON_ID=160604 /ORGANISM="Amphidinium massartii, Strain CS-259" /LENGTH=434 /DNA_ID=CAMNT_0020003823 /DNA_START=62 /DNA_END=1366 /DNA_ORIENTATION=-